MLFGIFVINTEAASRSSTFLGIGLGWNLYNKTDVEELGPVWVYNWTYPKATGNNPYSDFGAANYVPMVFGCGASANTNLQAWIERASYSGYVLYLNEPDNSSANGGANCAPADAVTRLSEFITWKNDYEQRTNKSIDVIFGGVYFGPDMWWARVYGPEGKKRIWLEEFYVLWKDRFGSNPDIAGIHFHLYPWNPVALDTTTMTAHLKRRMEGGRDPNYGLDLPGWNRWIDSNSWAKGNKGEIWITETGVLHPNVARNTVNQVMQNLIPYLSNNQKIKRVSWFSHAIKSTVTNYDQTGLMNLKNTARTSTWDTFQSLCKNDGYCVNSGNQPTATPTRTPSATQTPTPSPTRTTSPSPTRTPAPSQTITPQPSATRIPTSSPTPSPTSPPSGTSTRITPVADAYVSKSSPDRNYGNVSSLQVDANSGAPAEISYLKFPLGSVQGKNIQSAYLNIYITNPSSGTQTLNYIPNNSWTEFSITYNTSKYYNSVPLTSINSSQSGKYIKINVTAKIREYISARPGEPISLGIDSIHSDGLDFYSKEGSSKPVLEIFH